VNWAADGSRAKGRPAYFVNCSALETSDARLTTVYAAVGMNIDWGIAVLAACLKGMPYPRYSAARRDQGPGRLWGPVSANLGDRTLDAVARGGDRYIRSCLDVGLRGGIFATRHRGHEVSWFCICLHCHGAPTIREFAGGLAAAFIMASTYLLPDCLWCGTRGSQTRPPTGQGIEQENRS